MLRTKLKRLLVKTRRLQKNFNQVDPMTEVQNTAFALIKDLISNENSTLLISETGMYYLENSHYFIRFTNYEVTITNGKYSYYVWLPIEKTNILRSAFHQSNTRKAKKLERIYELKTLNNLKEMADTISALS
jgi:hypothetical protein